jgi:CBS-domain-containing membrane protein
MIFATLTRRTTRATPARINALTVVTIAVISTLMLTVLAGTAKVTGLAVLTPPLAATAMIIASMPATPPARPRAVLGGHLVSAIVGLVAAAVPGSSPFTLVAAGGLAAGLMALGRVMHAPAAATAVLVAAQHPAPLPTVLAFTAGSAVLIALGAGIEQLTRARNRARGVSAGPPR